MTIETAERRNVELAKTGVWVASTGVSTLTREHLQDAVNAYQDQAVDRPQIKVGHDDENPINAELGDGAPAFGWVENVTMGDGTAERPELDSLYGDYVGMPAKFADVADVAWRRRSVELDLEDPRYRVVLSAVSLLGHDRPAIKGLSDVLALYSDHGDTGGRVVLVQGDDVPQLDLAAIARFAAAEGHDTRTVPPSPANQSDGDTAAVQTTTAQEGPMSKTITKAAVDEALAQAGDEDIEARLRALLGDEDPAGAPAETAPVAAATATEQPAAAAAADDDVVTISKATFSELVEGAKAGKAAAEALATTRRDDLVKLAFSQGRITRDEQKVWRDKLDTDEATVAELLGSLQPRFSTGDIGHATPGALRDGALTDEQVDAAIADFLA